MSDVVVVGAGRVGLPVIGRLVRAGHFVQVVDVRPEVADAVISVGASWAGRTVERVAQGCVLITILPGSPELRAEMLGSHDGSGLLDRTEAGATWIDLTSAAPDLGSELAAAAADAGVGYLDVALGGGPRAAHDGTLTVYVGGDSGVLEQVRPILATFTADGRIHHMGVHGSGYLTKLLVNLLWFSQAVALGETLLLAKAAGLDLAQLQSILEASAASSAFITGYMPRLLDGDYVLDFGLDRCVEELESLRRFAEQANAPFRSSAQVLETHRDALAHFGAVDGELQAIAYLEWVAGTRLSGS